MGLPVVFTEGWHTDDSSIDLGVEAPYNAAVVSHSVTIDANSGQEGKLAADSAHAPKEGPPDNFGGFPGGITQRNAVLLVDGVFDFLDARFGDDGFLYKVGLGFGVVAALRSQSCWLLLRHCWLIKIAFFGVSNEE